MPGLSLFPAGHSGRGTLSSVPSAFVKAFGAQACLSPENRVCARKAGFQADSPGGGGSFPSAALQLCHLGHCVVGAKSTMGLSAPSSRCIYFRVWRVKVGQMDAEATSCWLNTGRRVSLCSPDQDFPFRAISYSVLRFSPKSL